MALARGAPRQHSTILPLRFWGLSDLFQSSDLLVNLLRHRSEVGIPFLVMF
jgi:hypothetical protein